MPVVASLRPCPARRAGVHSGGTQVSPVTPCLAQSRTTSRRQQVVDEDDMRTDREPGRQLAEPSVEAERQHREDDVVLVVAEVLADALRRRRAGCGARGRRPSAYRCCRMCRGSPPCRRRSRFGSGAVIDAAELAPAVTVRSARTGTDRSRRRPRSRARPTGSCAAPRASISSRSAEVTSTRTSQSRDDVANLLRAQQRVDRDEDAASGRGSEHRRHGLDPLVEVDGHPLAAAEADPLEPRGESEHSSQSSA